MASYLFYKRLENVYITLSPLRASYYSPCLIDVVLRETQLVND